MQAPPPHGHDLRGDSLWISTAMTFVPATTLIAGTVNTISSLSELIVSAQSLKA